MAAKKPSFMDELKDIIQCSICFEVYTDPRVLPCIHTFCLNCIAKTGSGRKSGQEVPCPICREGFKIPAQGFDGLRKNYFMSRLIEIANMTSPPSIDKLCDACIEERKDQLVNDTAGTPVADSFCVQCHQNLCQECSRHHKKNKLTKQHNVMAFGTPIDRDDLTKSFSSSLCDQHLSKPLEMFCTDCQTVICMMCFAENHQSHRCSDVKKVVQNFQRILKEDSEKVSQMKIEKVQEAENVQRTKIIILKAFENSEKMIRKRSEELKRLIDEHTKSLLKELNDMKSKKLKEIETELTDINRHVAILESYKKYSSNVSDKGSAADICQSTNELHEKIVALENAQEARVRIEANSQGDLFQQFPLQDYLTSNENIIGTLNDIPVFRQIQQQNRNQQGFYYDPIHLQTSNYYTYPTLNCNYWNK